MEWLSGLLGIKVEFRDLIAFLAVFVSVIAFVMKLNADTRIARYRETVAFIEKRDSELRALWSKVQRGDFVGGEREDALHKFMDHLELVSLLVRERVFDGELVYNYWWRFFDEPLRDPAINSWVQLEQEQDAAVLEHYLRQCKSWADRVDRERRRGKYATP